MRVFRPFCLAALCLSLFPGGRAAAQPAPATAFEAVLILDPDQLQPQSGALASPLTFTMAAKPSDAAVAAWRLDIVDSDGRIFRGFSGPWPQDGSFPTLVWDGKSETSVLVDADRSYFAVLSLSAADGRIAAAREAIRVRPLPEPPSRSKVQVMARGFSPIPASENAMAFRLEIAKPESLKSWRLEIVHEGRGLVRSFASDKAEIPASLSWDGTAQNGEDAPEGSYIAYLGLDYGDDFAPVRARSAAFILERSRPEITLSCSPAQFSQAADPAKARLEIRLRGRAALGSLADYRVEVKDASGRILAQFQGSWPDQGDPAPIEWTGYDQTGGFLAPDQSYSVVARCADEFGTWAAAQAAFSTGIILLAEKGRYKVEAPSLAFKAGSADILGLDAESAARNREILDRLAQTLSEYPDYTIRIVGHAPLQNWYDTDSGRRAQSKKLVPLTRGMAESAAKALIARGIKASRILSQGVGASEPLVPDADEINNWKNRRVEFFLEKP